MSDIVNDIKSRIDIADLIGEHVHLKRNGSGSIGFCPFHSNTRTPAFVVWPETGTWRCFGACNEGGDIFSYVMKRDGLDFREALDVLARRAGVEIKPMTREEQEQSRREHDEQALTDLTLDCAARFYTQSLWSDSGREAIDYVRARGLGDAHIRAIRWGWSQSDDGLLKWMAANHPACIGQARKLGLIRSDGKDFTANADGDKLGGAGFVVFPFVHHSRVISFSSRVVGHVARGDKTRHLPNVAGVYRADYTLYDPATVDEQHPRGQIVNPLDDDRLVICEGPFDAESWRAWGYRAICYKCGQGINEHDQPQLVERLRKQCESQTLYAAMSNDKNGAGQSFAAAFAELISPLVRIVSIPRDDDADKSDANQLLQQGATQEAVSEWLETAPTHLDMEILRVRKQRDVRIQCEGLEHLADLVCKLGQTERRIYIGTITDRIKAIGKKEFERMISDRMAKSNGSGVRIVAGELTWWGEALINAVPRIESERFIDDGQHSPTIKYDVSGRLALGGVTLPTIEMDSEELDSPKWIGKRWGARVVPYVNASRYTLLKRAILEHSLPNMKREAMYIYTGWTTINSKRAFLSASGALSEDGLDAAAHVELTNNLRHYSLPVPPTGDELVQAARASLDFLSIAPDLVTAPLWCGIYASPLTCIKSLDAILWVYGVSQSKKSSLAMLALSHFGDGFVQGRAYKAPQSWQSTKADIEGTLFTCKDIPVVVDDFAPQFTSAKDSASITKTAHDVSRGMGNRFFRGRRNADMTAKEQYPPRGLCISTAEQPLQGQSIVARTITVPIEAGTVNLERLTDGQNRHAQYSQCMAGFVQWLAANWDRATGMYARHALDAQNQMRGVFANQDRLSDYYAVLVSGGRLALDWMLEIGAIDETEHDSRATIFEMSLCELLSAQSERISAQSPVLKFFQAMEDLASQDKIILADRSNDQWSTPSWCTLAGWRHTTDDGKAQVWLLSAPVMALAKEYWAGLDERFDTLLDALRREMWQFGYLAARDDKQIEPSMYINKQFGTRRVLVIDADLVKERLGIELIKQEIAQNIGDADAPVRQ